MGFSDILESIFGSSQDQSNENLNKEAINVLSQGLEHLKTKNNQIKANKIGDLMEGFKTPKALVDATNVEKSFERKWKKNIIEV